MDNSGFRSIVESFCNSFIGQNRCRIVRSFRNYGLTSGTLDCLKVEVFDSHSGFLLLVLGFGVSPTRRIVHDAKTRTSLRLTLRVVVKDIA